MTATRGNGTNAASSRQRRRATAGAREEGRNQPPPAEPAAPFCDACAGREFGARISICHKCATAGLLPAPVERLLEAVGMLAPEAAAVPEPTPSRYVRHARVVTLRNLASLHVPGEPEDLDMELPRPRTRAECANAPRPCPFVSCRYHLYLDVHQSSGSLTLNFPDADPDELPATCALDVADAGPATLEHVGELLNISRERVRQLEERLIHQLRARGVMARALEMEGEHAGV
jgi:hypothetical protein